MIQMAYGAPKAPDVSPDDDRYKNLELFQKVLHFVESNYVEEVKNQDLVYGAIKGLMDTLDPHSNFLPPKIYKDMKVDTSGKFGGLGIEIGVRDNILTIVAPIEGTPAWKAGLQPGDRIVKINGKTTKGMTLVEAVAQMRGSRGSKVNLGIFRKGSDKIRDVSIERDVIKINPIRSEILESQYGYLRLSSFNEHAEKDLLQALDSMEQKEKLRGLVLDMRTNPGGLLEQAVKVSSAFLDDGVIVSTVGRDKNKTEVKHARKGKARKHFQMVVLVNSSTASAAEIVAGALQDHKRAIIMGQPTFGKGSVQTVIELNKDLGLKLTVARYYTPNGRSIQEKGVIPDILLDQYDPKLLAKAKIGKDFTREKDLPGHIVNEQDPSDYTTEELKVAGDKKKEDAIFGKDTSDSESSSSSDEAWKPLKFDPKSDFQVQQALNYLKSFEIFKKISSPDGKKEEPTKEDSKTG